MILTKYFIAHTLIIIVMLIAELRKVAKTELLPAIAARKKA